MPRAKISLDDLAELCVKVLSTATQPLSVYETHVLASRESEHEFSDTHTRNALQLATEAGLLAARVETPDERALRAEGRPVGNQLSTLYQLATSPVAPRTVASPVKGVRLGDGSQFADSRRRSRQRRRKPSAAARPVAKKAAPAPAPAASPATDVRMTVERLVQLELEMKQLADERERLLSELG